MEITLPVVFAMVSCVASAATTQPKVVYIGEASNPTWMNEGVDGVGYRPEGETSDETLARFQSDVVALHPAIVQNDRHEQFVASFTEQSSRGSALPGVES